MLPALSTLAFTSTLVQLVHANFHIHLSSIDAFTHDRRDDIVLTQCDAVALGWAAGKAPYSVVITDDQNNVLDSLTTQEPSLSWPVKAKAGSKITFDAKDAEGAENANGPFAVKAGDNTSCLGNNASPSPSALASSTSASAPAEIGSAETSSAAASTTAESAAVTTTAKSGVNLPLPLARRLGRFGPIHRRQLISSLLTAPTDVVSAAVASLTDLPGSLLTPGTSSVPTAAVATPTGSQQSASYIAEFTTVTTPSAGTAASGTASTGSASTTSASSSAAQGYIVNTTGMMLMAALVMGASIIALIA